MSHSVHTLSTLSVPFAVFSVKSGGRWEGEHHHGRGWGGGSGLGGSCPVRRPWLLCLGCSAQPVALSHRLTGFALLLGRCCCCTLDGSFSGLAASVGVGQSECTASCECQGHRALRNERLRGQRRSLTTAAAAADVKAQSWPFPRMPCAPASFVFIGETAWHYRPRHKTCFHFQRKVGVWVLLSGVEDGQRHSDPVSSTLT